MPIAFTTGTINAANAGSVGLAMAEKIRDDVVSHVAWELVEEYTAASGLVTWYVFRCLAASSGLPSDFHVVMGRTIGSGELRIALCEGYNSSTHVMSFYGIAYAGGANQAYDSSGRRANTYTLSTAVFPTSPPNPAFNAWIPSGVSTKWWITVDNDGFSVAFNGASNGFFHIGAYIPLTPIPLTLPVINYGNSPSSSNQATITRNPALASLTAKDSGISTLGYGASLGYAGPLDRNDKLHLDMRPVAELGIVMYQAAGDADAELVGGILGKHKRMRAGKTGTSPAGFAFGDAYVLQGRLWVPYLPTDNRLWDTGVAV